MKKILSIVLLLGFFLNVFAQRDDINKQLEQLGQNHNDFLTYMFTKTKENKLSLCDKKSYKVWNQWAKDFFATKQAKWDGDFVEFYAANKWDEQSLYPRKELSSEANAYLQKLSDQISLLNDNNLAEFVSFCNSLQKDALANLKNDNDAVCVGSAIVVAKYSSQYWDKNFAEWSSYYSTMPCSPKNQAKLSPTEKQVLQDDSKGAIAGAIGGFVAGGPVTAVAGALVNGGWASCVSAVTIGFGIRHITDWLW